jgi:hypothetical protein
MADTKDMKESVYIYAGKVYGPGIVSAPTLPDAIKDIPVDELDASPGNLENVPDPYVAPTTPQPVPPREP